MKSDIKITDFVDFNPKRVVKKGNVAPFIDMAALPVNSRDVTSIGERKFKGSGSKFLNGDTLFARITPCLENGKTAKVAGLPEGVAASGSTEFIVMAAKEPEYDEDYIYYLARLPEFRAYAQARMEGTSGRQRVPWQSLAEFSFAFPDKHKRKEAGDLLKKIDDKIEVNRQLNQTLEKITQTIFKSWFVDFDPTRAKIDARENGQDPERAAMCAISGKADSELDQLSSEELQELKATAALFPDSLIESELGEAPEGWEVIDLKTATTEIRRGISPKYTEEDGVLVLNQKCIRHHSIDFTLARKNDPLKRKVDSRLIELGDVLVNSTGVGTLGRLAPVKYLDEPTVVDSHVTVVRADTKIITKSFLASLMIEKEAYIENSGAGSTGQTELRKQVLEDILFIKPSLTLCLRFESIMSSITDQKSLNEVQKYSLSKLRDTLLPKLLSGELPVKKGIIKDYV